MEGVKDVRQLDATHLHWVVEHDGRAGCVGRMTP
jgi:hypothetical protein